MFGTVPLCAVSRSVGARLRRCWVATSSPTFLRPSSPRGRPLFQGGSRAAAVFEAVKAVDIRVQQLTQTNLSGKPLMGKAFAGQSPLLRFNGGANQVDLDEQEGIALIFMGTMLGIRNPKAHSLLEEMDERRALDYLGLASLLMRLDDVEARVISPP